MSPNSHFKELLSALNRYEAKYLVVGGYAVMLYTEPRYTKDLDIWIEATAENAARVYRALAEFGAPLAGIAPAEFCAPDVVYQLGMPPSRIDILTCISGVNFADAWPRRREANFDGIPATFVHIDDLLANKRATARDSDLLDCKRLEEARAIRTDPV